MKKDDEEFLWLFNSVYSKDAPIYDYKGYAVVTDTVVKDVQVNLILLRYYLDHLVN